MLTDELAVSQYPGGFFIFWNVVVPLSVLLNVKRFGLRKHEVGLIAALSLNPYLLQVFMRSVIASTIVVIFLILVIQKILSRWSWYRIYSYCFLRNSVLLLAMIAVPNFLLKMLWHPITCLIRTILGLLPLPKDTTNLFVDACSLLFAIALLTHAIVLKRKRFDTSASSSCSKPKRAKCAPKKKKSKCKQQPLD